MSLGLPEWPEVGDFVVTTVLRVESYGAYVSLDEYKDKEGLLHISEISSRWVRNIRNHVRPNQKIVLQVLRTDASKGQVDLSLRRVSRDEKRKKLESWKKARKAETLLAQAAQELGTSLEALYDSYGVKLVQTYGGLYEALEAASKKGVDVLTEAGVTGRAADVIAAIAQDKIIVKGVTIQGVFEAMAMSNSGVMDIKEAFMKAEEAAQEYDAAVKIYTLGAPKYRIELTAEDYKKAEQALDQVVKSTQKAWTGFEGSVSFTRE